MERLEHAVRYATAIKRKRTFKAGLVYAIACHDYVKFGIADDMPQRLSQLQVGCPYELRVIRVWKSSHARHDEARLHSKLKRYEVRGEWFYIPMGELEQVLACDSLAILLGSPY